MVNFKTSKINLLPVNRELLASHLTISTFDSNYQNFEPMEWASILPENLDEFLEYCEKLSKDVEETLANQETVDDFPFAKGEVFRSTCRTQAGFSANMLADESKCMQPDVSKCMQASSCKSMKHSILEDGNEQEAGSEQTVQMDYIKVNHLSSTEKNQSCQTTMSSRNNEEK